MKAEAIIDYIAFVIPEDEALDNDDDELRDKLTVLAGRMILAQYGSRPPKALLIEPIDWLITSNADDVERHQPAHKCVTCLAGNDQARAFLTEHPERRLALGNLRYTEVWK